MIDFFKNIDTKIIYGIVLVLVVLSIFVISKKENYEKTIETSSTVDNEKIEWGIKRNNNNTQPELGNNKKILEEFNGIAIGNNEKNYIYLTFDCGYEAGYTEKILNSLKEKEVKAAFFITGHYLDTAEDLVKRMIDEGHIVGNQSPHTLMEL